MGNYEKHLITIGKNLYYRKGNLFFYRTKSNVKKSKRKNIKAKDFITILLEKI